MTTATTPRKPRAKKPGHTGFRNNALFCFNCGRSHAMQYPIEVSMFTAIAKQFEKSHKNCAKQWTPPVPDMSQGENERIAWWLAHGEHGVSSMWVLNSITGAGKREYGHPHDPDDFRRCYLVLKAIPELRDGFHVLAATSPQWAKLVEHWDQLTTMLEAAMTSADGKAPEMYELMKSLGC